MKAISLDKSTVAHRVIGLAEEWLNRPFAVRDWILRAKSEDGLAWQVDPSFRFNPAKRVGEAMSYYAARSPDGKLWLRSSVRRPSRSNWETILTSHDRTVTIDCARFGTITSLSWSAHRLYCVVQLHGSAPAPACFEAPVVDPDQWRVVSLSFRPWPINSVEDFHVCQWMDGWLAWIASRNDEGRTIISQWHSSDGWAWELSNPNIFADVLGAEITIANNPWAMPPAAEGEPWRLYFRIGEQPAVDNRIVSTISTNVTSWQLEPGVRIAPHGAWAAHGVGFPFVERNGTDDWTMYFSGFWGASTRGQAAAELWRTANRRHNSVFQDSPANQDG